MKRKKTYNPVLKSLFLGESLEKVKKGMFLLEPVLRLYSPVKYTGLSSSSLSEDSQ